MRKNLICLVLLMLALVPFGCKSDSSSELLSNIPGDADVVMVGNLKTIYESAGVEVNSNNTFKFPAYITDEIPSRTINEFEEFNQEFLKNSGINLDCVGAFCYFRKDRMVVVFNLKDKKKFITAIEDKKFSEYDKDGDVTVFRKLAYENSYDPEYNNYSWIAIKDNYAYYMENVWVGSSKNATTIFKMTFEGLAEGNYADTHAGKYIVEGNLGGVAVQIPSAARSEMRENGVPTSLTNIFDGIFCLKADLDGSKAKANFVWLGEDGKVKDMADIYPDYSPTKISKNAIKHFGKDIQMVFGVSLKDFNWNKLFDQIGEMRGISRSDRAMIATVSGYLNKIDGTVAYGVGLKNGLESIKALNKGRNVLEELAVTVVVETKKDKAKAIISDLESLLAFAGIRVEKNGSVYELNLPGAGTVYAKADDNILVISTMAITDKADSPALKTIDFTDYASAVAIALNKKNPLMKGLDLNFDVEAAAFSKGKKVEGELFLEIDGGNGGIVEKMIRITHTFKDLDKKLRDYSYNDYDDSYCEFCNSDTVACEEIVDECVVDSCWADSI